MSDSSDSEKKHLFTKSNYLLDLEHLHGLEKIAPLGDVDKFMSDLSILFLKEAPMSIQELDRALIKGDMKAITQHSYRLKGICAGIGAKYMTDLCQQIEKSVLKKELSLTRTLGEQLKDSFLVTRDQVLAYIAQLHKKV